MIPSNSNNTSGCDPISSNCVIWQGPDLACVGVCNGDTVSDIVAKLCERLIEVSDAGGASVDLSTMSMSSLEGDTSSTLTELLQQIIDNIIAVRDEERSAGMTCEDALLCESNVPTCLQEKTISDKTTLGTSAYLELLGSEVCSLRNGHELLKQGAIAANTSNITQLQADQYTTPKIYTSSIGTTTTLQSIDKVLQQFELEYSLLSNALNTPTSLYAGVSAQGTMVPLVAAGWQGTYNTAPTTVSHTIENLWSVIKDLRTKVTDLEGLIVAPASNVYPLMGGSSNTYVTDADCNSACLSTASTNLINIYNETGSVFDTSVRAYTDAAATTEIGHGEWFVISGTTTVARYSTISPFWRDVITDCDTNSICA
jgi:hypothetical protein